MADPSDSTAPSSVTDFSIGPPSTAPSSIAPSSAVTSSATSPLFPRVTIQYCTQCKWMLRAAYFGQELLSTFSTSLGEVALQPATGGVFRVAIQVEPERMNEGTNTVSTELPAKLLWDRKKEGGFPEVKELKRRVRDVIDPNRNLGHVDRGKTNVKVVEGEGGERIEASMGAERLGKDVREEADMNEEKVKMDEKDEKRGQWKANAKGQCEDC